MIVVGLLIGMKQFTEIPTKKTEFDFQNLMSKHKSGLFMLLWMCGMMKIVLS